MLMIAERNAIAPRILITERNAEPGIDLLRSDLPEALIDERFGLQPAQLHRLIGEYTALIIRSQTRITEDVLAAAPYLHVIGRTGSGVDNIEPLCGVPTRSAGRACSLG